MPNIQIAITGYAEASNYPLDTFYWLLRGLMKKAYDLSEDEIDGKAIEYPLTVKICDTDIGGTDSDSYLECTITQKGDKN